MHCLGGKVTLKSCYSAIFNKLFLYFCSMDFRTKVSLDWQGERISHSHSLIFMGSCFAEEIGTLFGSNKFDTLINPFGVLYNPLSIANALRRTVERRFYSDEELVKGGNLYHSFGHHSAFSHTDASLMIKTINEGLSFCHERLKGADFMFLTFGTAWVYELKSSGEVVANCHKFPSSDFVRRRASVEELVRCMAEVVERVLEFNPNMKIVLTVSPIRHLKDGAHGNALSKSTLLLMCDELQRMFSGKIAYLPSYEILLDELRDYRFYADDMTHPSSKTVEYIWERIKDEVLSQRSVALIKEWTKIRQGINHRLMSADIEGYRCFLRNLLKISREFQERYPELNISQEICELERRIDNDK